MAPALAPVRRWMTTVPLRWLLIMALVLPTVGGAGLVGYLSDQNGQSAVKDLGHQLVAMTNQQVGQELKTYLKIPFLINRLNIDAVHQGQLNLEDSAALERTLLGRLQEFEPVSTVLFTSPEGRLRLVERLPDLYLGAAEPSQPERILLYALNPQGERGPLVATEPDLDLRRDRPWYRRAVATGQPGWDSIFQYGTLDVLTLNASEPVYDAAGGQLLGVFAVHIQLDYLNEFLHGLAISRAGQVLITDPAGQLVATSTLEKPYRTESQDNTSSALGRLRLDQSQNELTRALGDYLLGHSEPLSALEPTSNLAFRFNGEPQFVTITPFADQYGLDWRIVTVIPKSHFLGAIRTGAHQTLVLCLLTLGLAVTLGLLAANLFTACLQPLNRVSRELATGNLDQRLSTDSPIGELNDLAQSFNQMADQLQQAFSHLQTALAESEEKFSTVFRTSPDPMAIASLAEGRILAANQSMLQFFGYTHSEMVGHTALELNLWGSLGQRSNYRAQLYQGGQVRNYEVQLRTKSGDLKTGLLSAEVQTLDGQDCVIVVHRDISDRKQAEAALQHSEALNRAILNALPDLIFRMHHSGQYVYIKSNTTFPTDLPNFEVGQTIHNVLPPDIAQQELVAVKTALQTGEMQVFEYPLWVQGQHLWQEARIMPLYPDEVLVVVRDLTLRNRAELALQESEVRFRQLAETVQEGFFVYEIDPPHYSYINPAYTSILGTQAEVGSADMSHWLSHIHPDDLGRVKAALQREDEGENFDEEYRFLGPIGDLRWLHSKAFPLRNQAGAIFRIVGTVEDITSRKHIEAALRESEDLFRRAFDDIPIGITLVSSTGQFIKANTYFCTLVGYTEAELMALNFQTITYPEDLESDLAGFEKLRVGQIRSSQLEKRYIDKQGNIVPVFIDAAPIFDDSGQFVYCVGYIQDIRERQKIERMKDEFISIVSHELRTPIASIQGALVLLDAGVYNGRPEKVSHMLRIAINNSHRLVRLVNDILSLERLASGKVQLAMEQCQVADIMQLALDSVQTIADQAAITLTAQPLATPLWADPDAMVQTLTNLLSNAIKFSAPGDTVWLKAEILTKAHLAPQIPTPQAAVVAATPLTPPPIYPSSILSPLPSLLLTVKDQGRGIPEDKLDLIFEQFQQVDVSDARQKGGTGLGLAICKKIVRQHGGQIWVESQLGQGSTFYVALPLTVETSDA
ncbi:MAG: PAS domain S-box protein [Nodosilinea sp.]